MHTCIYIYRERERDTYKSCVTHNYYAGAMCASMCYTIVVMTCMVLYELYEHIRIICMYMLYNSYNDL